MADKRYINGTYQDIAQDLIENEESLAFLREADVSILLLSSCAKKKKAGMKVLGVCEKIADKYKWTVPCDFTITIFDKNCEGLDLEQLRILIFHELLHVGYDAEEKKCFVKEHDLTEFKEIIDRFGTDWAKVESADEAEGGATA